MKSAASNTLVQNKLTYFLGPLNNGANNSTLSKANSHLNTLLPCILTLKRKSLTFEKRSAKNELSIDIRFLTAKEGPSWFKMLINLTLSY